MSPISVKTFYERRESIIKRLRLSVKETAFFLLQLEQKKKTNKKRTGFRPDLNWRPSACEADVITTTLRKPPEACRIVQNYF